MNYKFEEPIQIVLERNQLFELITILKVLLKRTDDYKIRQLLDVLELEYDTK